MERTPGLVSVIIPCYNHGAYIHEALGSIIKQTFQDFEIIVVDDGSNDSTTRRILKQIDIPRVTVYHKENGHLSAARNYGIERSKGDYILTLDADDLFDPTFLEKAVPVLRERPTVGVVTCYYKYFGSARTRTFLPKGGGIHNFLCGNDCCGNALFRHACWVDAGGYNPAQRGLEDWDFWIGVTKKGWLVHSIPEFLFHYRDTPNSMLKSIEKKHPDLIRQIVEHHRDVYQENVADVIYQNQVKIATLKEKLRALEQARKDSLTYKSRRLALAPLKFINRALNPRRTRAASF